MLGKNPRTAEPKGGRIDYDIDGRFVGNWRRYLSVIALQMVNQGKVTSTPGPSKLNEEGLTHPDPLSSLPKLTITELATTQRVPVSKLGIHPRQTPRHRNSQQIMDDMKGFVATETQRLEGCMLIRC